MNTYQSNGSIMQAVYASTGLSHEEFRAAPRSFRANLVQAHESRDRKAIYDATHAIRSYTEAHNANEFLSAMGTSTPSPSKQTMRPRALRSLLTNREKAREADEDISDFLGKLN